MTRIQIVSHACRRLPAVLAAFTLVTAMMAAQADSAFAAHAHVFVKNFGSFSDPESVATDDSGNVYVIDVAAGTLSKYDSSGNAVDFSALGTNTISGFSFDSPSAAQVAVDNSGGVANGDIYVASFAGVDIYAADGTHLGQLTEANGSPYGEACGVAVDPSGNVYVGDYGGEIDRYAPTSNPVTNADFDAAISVPSGICNVAADSTGAVYGSTYSDGPLTKYPASDFGGAGVGTQITADSQAVGIDPATDDVYVAQSSDIAVFSSSGTPLGSFGAANVNTPRGVAVDQSGNVFVGNSGAGNVSIFALGPVVPDVFTGTATDLGNTSATLTGTVNPDGIPVTDCHFDYGPTTAYGQSAPCVETVGSGTSDVTVHADLTGLAEGKFYHFRLDAANASGSNQGADQTFVTTGIGIASFDGGVYDAAGNPYTQAGGHPYTASATITFNSHTRDDGSLGTDTDVKDIHVDLPPGLIGNPQAIPKCTQAQFGQGFISPPQCPVDSQVGTLTVGLAFGGSTPLVGTGPVYNMVPPTGVAAEFAVQVATVTVHIDASVGPAPNYGVSLDIKSISQAVGLISSKLSLWGVPADSEHNAQRYCTGSEQPPCGTTAPQVPFLTMPTACLGPQVTTMSADSWQSPGDFASASFVSHDNSNPPNPIGATGCNALDFSPSISVQPTSQEADSPTGLHVDLSMPQNDNPDGTAEADLKEAVVDLPTGMTVNPSSADGLVGCTPAQIDFTSTDPAACPDASKVGSVEITTPLVDHPLDGAVYLATQGTNPFNSLLALYIAIDDPQTGVVLKLAGKVVPNPQTGQLEASFDNNPQLPFSNLTLDFNAGSRGVLITPPSCGTYETQSALSPWSAVDPDNPTAAETRTSTDSFAITTGPAGGPCPAGGFNPSLNAGLSNASAGSSSTFTLQLLRRDGDQNVSGLTTVLPPGLVAKLAGVPLCPEPQATTGDCPANSQIGSTIVGVGAGTTPVYIPQAGKSPTAVYLAGPYKGAPYSLVIMVPAQAGPFNLGVVTVRAGIYVNPTTAQVTVISDPLPQIIQGIPLPYRDIRVIINRPGFMIAPTSCAPMQLLADVSGVPIGGPVSVNAADVGYSTAASSVVHLTDRFQVGGCAALPFSPKLKLALSGKGQTRSADHPTLTATLTQPKGQANIASTEVALPLSLALDPNNSQHVCSYTVAKAVTTGPVDCPASTLIGHAKAITPLLSQPLTGPVYLVQGIRYSHGNRIRTLPTLLVALRGQIALDLRAKTSVNGAEQLVTTFPAIPDAAVSKFVLTINGGHKGILVITGRGRTICGKPQVADASLGAQSGKSESPAITISTPCRASGKT